MPDRGRFDDTAIGEPVSITILADPTQPERTFPPESIHAVAAAMVEFTLTQLAKSWERSGKPPKKLVVTVQCEVS